MEFFPAPLENLVEQFARLPGIGSKSAQRLAFHVLNLPQDRARAFADAILEAKRSVTLCPVCQNLTSGGLCPICHRRQNAVGHLVPDKEVDHVQNDGRPEGHEPQLVHAVAPIHEPGQGVANFLEEIHTSASFCKKMRSFRKRTHLFYRNLPQT